MDDIPDSPIDDTLTPEEQAHFDSHGEAPLPDSPPEPEKKAAPEPEVKDEIEGDGKDKVTYVRQEALHEERQRRKSIERDLALAREEKARVEGMLNALKSPKADATAAPDGEPDIDKDPVAWIKWDKAQRAKVEQETREQREFRERAESIAEIGRRHSEAFAKEKPDYFDAQDGDGKPVKGAYNYLREKAIERIAEQHPEATIAQINQAVDLHELSMISECRDRGVNAASEVYRLAIEQGYTPRQAAAAAKAEAAKPTEAERIAALEKAQAGAKSLSATPGGGGASQMTLEALADLPDDEFEAATAGGKWERLHRDGALGR